MPGQPYMNEIGLALGCCVLGIVHAMAMSASA